MYTGTQMQLMWENTVGKLKAETFFIEDRSVFLVKVSHLKTKESLEEEFETLYPPLFGMDVQDSNTSLSIAEELALKIETPDES